MNTYNIDTANLSSWTTTRLVDLLVSLVRDITLADYNLSERKDADELWNLKQAVTEELETR